MSNQHEDYRALALRMTAWCPEDGPHEPFGLLHAGAHTIRSLLAASTEADRDVARFRWLTEDHADPASREAVRLICRSIPARTLSATRMSIDAAMLVHSGFSNPESATEAHKPAGEVGQT